MGKSNQEKPKGQKRMRGQGVDYNEVKKDINLTLTPTLIKRMKEEAKMLGTKPSNLIETFFRHRYDLPLSEKSKHILDKL